MAITFDVQIPEIKKYKYSIYPIQDATSYISRAYPISSLSANDSAEIIKLLAEALQILSIKKLDKTGDTQPSTFRSKIYSNEIVEEMTNGVNDSYKNATMSAEESTLILHYLMEAVKIVFSKVSVPFTYKEVEYNFADKNKEDEIDGIINMFADTFSREDKQKCLGLSYDDVRQHMELHVKEEILDQNVMVAKDEEGNIIGALSWQDFLKDTYAYREKVSSKYLPNFALWKILKDKFTEFYKKIVGEEIRVGNVVCIRSAAVNRLLMEKVFNRDIGNIFTLFLPMLTYGGYKAIFGAEASVIAQHLTTKYGAIALNEIVYETFTLDGQKPFKNIYAKTSKEDSLYKSMRSAVGFTDPYLMEMARQLIRDQKQDL